MIDRITTRLEKRGIEDFEVVKKIPADSISVNSDLQALKVYFPKEYEYDQYEVDDFFRSLPGYIRTKTVLDRNIYIMTVTGRITEDQYYKLLQFIIEEESFVAIIDNEED